MAGWIVVKGPFDRKFVEPGYVLKPWESIDVSEQRSRHDHTLDSAARHFGMNLADFIEWAARCLNIPPCPRCQMSKQVLYKMNEIGWMRGITLLWHIRWKRTSTHIELKELCQD